MSRAADTSLGGGDRQFPQTRPDLVVRFREPGRPEYRAALEELCRRYWKPVYFYARLSWAQSNEDAKDLTQAFFAWLLEGEPLRTYVPERGGFRPFLKTLLARFAGHEREAQLRLKRGGGRVPIRLEDDSGLEASVLRSRESVPLDVFDRQWLAELMRTAVDRVRAQFRSKDREIQFRVFEEHDLSNDPEAPGYQEIADRLRLKESQVRDYLATVRRAVRQEIREELGRMTSDDREMDNEWRELFGG